MPTWTEATRPLITLILIGTACYLAIIDKIDPKDFMSMAMIVVLFWFKERQDVKTSEQTMNQLKTLSETQNQNPR